MNATVVDARVRRLRPRPLICVVAHLHRDLAIATDACAGRFTNAGATLDLGDEPDWLGAGLADDVEWRYEWSKFSFGLDLAHAYTLSGEPRFSETWERLVRSWIEQVPVDRDPTYITGRRIQNLLHAWDAIASAPGFDAFGPGFEELLLDSLEQQARWLEQHLTAERNHRTLELYALLLLALAFPEQPGAGPLRDRTVPALARNALADFHPDGVHREASTHYHTIVLRSLIGAVINARRHGVEFPEAFLARVERACDVTLHLRRPDGEIPALSDADGGSYGDVLALAAQLFGRPDFRYGATLGCEGSPPSRRHVDLPDGGYHVQRSGWGAGTGGVPEERFLVFDCGPLGEGGHGHYDALAIEAFAYGRPLVVDPGRFTYAEGDPNLRRRFKGTAAHSTVCVDRLDQTPYRPGKPKTEVAQTCFLGRMGGPGLDVLRGSVLSPAYDAVHTRRIVFVADEWWLIEDRLNSGRPHLYEQRFQLAPEAFGAIEIERRDACARVLAPGLALLFGAELEPVLETGWVSRSYGRREPAPVVSATLEGNACAMFLTALVPLPELEADPYLHVSAIDGATQVELGGRSGGQRDLVVWSHDGRSTDLGALGTGAAGWLRLGPDGRKLGKTILTEKLTP